MRILKNGSHSKVFRNSEKRTHTHTHTHIHIYTSLEIKVLELTEFQILDEEFVCDLKIRLLKLTRSMREKALLALLYNTS